MVGKSKQLVIRMTLHGCKHRHYHRIVVSKKTRPRDIGSQEQIGIYDPVPNSQDNCVVSIDFARLHHYLRQGAELSDPMQKLLGLCGYLPLHPSIAHRAKKNREERAAEEKLVADADPSRNKETVITDGEMSANEGTPV